MIERSRDIKILYRKFTRSIERWCSSLPPLGVIRLESSHTLVFTIFLHGLNISRDYRNFHSPWSMVFRYERLTSAIFFPQRRSISPRDTTVFRPHNLRHIELHASFLPELSRKIVSLSRPRDKADKIGNGKSGIANFEILSPLFPRSSKLTAEYNSNRFPARNAIYHAR